jgi:hypothetical protein
MHTLNHQLLAVLQYPARDLELSGYRAPSLSTMVRLLMHTLNHQLLAVLQYPARDLDLSGRLYAKCCISSGMPRGMRA